MGLCELDMCRVSQCSVYEPSFGLETTDDVRTRVELRETTTNGVAIEFFISAQFKNLNQAALVQDQYISPLSFDFVYH